MLSLAAVFTKCSPRLQDQAAHREGAGHASLRMLITSLLRPSVASLRRSQAPDFSVQIARLAMLSLAAVFKDILPGYKIRPPTEKELAMPVSKEVKKLRDHESGLLRAYQASSPTAPEQT